MPILSHIMLSLSLCKCSRFIDKLVKNGYNNTLTTLLCDLNLDTFSCNIIDIHELLYKTNYDISNELINKIGVETAITICDELCAPNIVNIIIRKEIMLDKLSEHQILNHHIYNQHIDIYGRGYRIIINNNFVAYNHSRASSINNAYDNGLYTPCIHLVNITNDVISQIMPCALHDIREISNTQLNTATSCKNVDTISGLLCDGTKQLPFAKNIKHVSISQLNCNYVNLQQFTQLRELDINFGRFVDCVQLPPSLNILHVCDSDTNLGDWAIKMCTRLKELNACSNSHITTCAPFAQHLVKLHARESCGINDNGLRMCYRLKVLNATNNPKITTCIPFAKTLRILSAKGDCGIDDNGLRMCHRLKVLDATNNSQITIRLPRAKN